MNTTTSIFHVYPDESGQWCVRPEGESAVKHDSKAQASLMVQLHAANSGGISTVIFYNPDGSVEFKKVFKGRNS